MAGVWLARDSSLDRPCAVKLLDGSLLDDREVVTRFRSEARSTACIRSPHVIEIFDHGTWCRLPFIVMEFVDGEDLGTRLQRVQRLDLPTTYRIVKQLASGLSSAHAAGIVHRDLKPANVLLGSVEGREIAKIIDFGVANNARIPGSTVVRGLLLGTPEYMSPEQARGLPIDARTDVFSLGVLTYECLSGQTPSDREQGLEDALHEGIPRLAGIVPGIPAAFDLWIARALARDRERRFQSPRELADALGRLVGEHFSSVGVVPGFELGTFSVPERQEPGTICRVFLPVNGGPGVRQDSSGWPRTCSGAVVATQARCAPDSAHHPKGRHPSVAGLFPSAIHRPTGVRGRGAGQALLVYGAALVLPMALGVLALVMSSASNGTFAEPAGSLRIAAAPPGDAKSRADGLEPAPAASGDSASPFTADAPSTNTSEPKPIVTPDPRPLGSLELRSDDHQVRFRRPRSRPAARRAREAGEATEAAAMASPPDEDLANADMGLADKLARLRRHVLVSNAHARLELSIPVLAAPPDESAQGPRLSHNGEAEPERDGPISKF